MRIAIHQPNFLPHIGWFHKASMVDIMVLYDNVQYTDKQFQNRNRLRNKYGWQWVTVPVHAEHGVTLIKDVTVANEQKNWAKKMSRTITYLYKDSEYYKRYFPGINSLLAEFKWERLINLNNALISLIHEYFELKCDLINASTLDVGTDLVDICNKLNADEYVTGSIAKDYYDQKPFDEAGIKVILQNFVHPEYKQRFSGFEPNMSAIDLLFNVGKYII